jgi:hypothetical protein
MMLINFSKVNVTYKKNKMYKIINDLSVYKIYIILFIKNILK